MTAAAPAPVPGEDGPDGVLHASARMRASAPMRGRTTPPDPSDPA